MYQTGKITYIQVTHAVDLSHASLERDWGYLERNLVRTLLLLHKAVPLMLGVFSIHSCRCTSKT